LRGGGGSPGGANPKQLPPWKWPAKPPPPSRHRRRHRWSPQNSDHQILFAGCDSLAGIREIVPGEEFPAQLDNRPGDDAMHLVPESALLCAGEILRVAGRRQQAGLVFVEVIRVGAYKAAEHGPGNEIVALAFPELEGNLEIDQPGPAIVAEENVFPLVGVD